MRSFVLGLAAVATLLFACAPQPAGNSGAGTASSPPAAPKILTFAIQRAPDDMHPDMGPRDPGVGGSGLVPGIPHEGLMVTDSRDSYVPRLAVKPISTEDGSWEIGRAHV